MWLLDRTERQNGDSGYWIGQRDRMVLVVTRKAKIDDEVVLEGIV